MSRQDYKTLQEAFEEMNEAIARLGRAAAKEGLKDQSKAVTVLAKAGIDGKLTGADVVISLSGLGFGVAVAILVAVAKLADGYGLRDAIGVGVDILTIVVAVLLIRFLLDVLSVPTILASIFEVKSIINERPEPAVVSHPVFINREVRSGSSLFGLPNGETVDTVLLREFLQAVRGQDGKVWSRQEWCNAPTDPKRPGRGLMTQEEWAGVKQLLEELGAWRSNDTSAIDELLRRES